jgi:hypothetical protein
MEVAAVERSGGADSGVGKTRGLWVRVGVETQAYGIGPPPDQNPQLLTSCE